MVVVLLQSLIFAVGEGVYSQHLVQEHSQKLFWEGWTPLKEELTTMYKHSLAWVQRELLGATIFTKGVSNTREEYFCCCYCLFSTVCCHRGEPMSQPQASNKDDGFLRKAWRFFRNSATRTRGSSSLSPDTSCAATTAAKYLCLASSMFSFDCSDISWSRLWSFWTPAICVWWLPSA